MASLPTTARPRFASHGPNPSILWMATQSAIMRTGIMANAIKMRRSHLRFFLAGGFEGAGVPENFESGAGVSPSFFSTAGASGALSFDSLGASVFAGSLS